MWTDPLTVPFQTTRFCLRSILQLSKYYEFDFRCASMSGMTTVSLES